jgi:hypothetical protein
VSTLPSTTASRTSKKRIAGAAAAAAAKVMLLSASKNAVVTLFVGTAHTAMLLHVALQLLSSSLYQPHQHTAHPVCSRKAYLSDVLCRSTKWCVQAPSVAYRHQMLCTGTNFCAY